MTDKPPPPAKIRPARRGDAEGIKLMMAELGHQTNNDTVNWVISHPEMEVLVAADSLDKVVGMVAFSHRPRLKLGGRIATIDEIVVGLQWRRKGIGRDLLKRACERAKVLGVKRVEAQSLDRDPTIQGFFSACALSLSDAGVFVSS